MHNIDNQEEHWNNHYKNKKYALLNYDGWLDQYFSLFEKNCKVIDIGCGSGSDTDILIKRGFFVCSIDFSDEALKILKQLVPDALPKKVDITKKLPFETNCFDVAIADLSLHYFKWDITIKIVDEISRILKDGGIIIARFNSDKDYSFGVNDGSIIEPGLRLVKGRTKRFFTGSEINELFRMWDITSKTENITARYTKTKAYWELVAYNRKEKI